jgi:hypothetical protein
MIGNFFRRLYKQRRRNNSKFELLPNDISTYYASITNSPSFENALKSIIKEFKKCGLQVGESNKKVLEHFLRLATLSNEELSSKKFEGLVAISEKLLTEVSDISFLVHLYLLSLRSGLFIFGLKLRETISNIIETDYLRHFRSLSSTKIEILVTYLIEKERFSEAMEVLRVTRKTETPYGLVFQKYIKGLSNYSPDLTSLITHESIVEVNPELYKFINEKKLCIVGPAKTQKPDGIEIDEFEVVCKLNVRNTITTEEAAIKGSKLDINILSDAKIDSVLKEGKFDWTNKAKWLIINSTKNMIGIQNLFGANVGQPNKFTESPNIYVRLFKLNKICFIKNFYILPKVLGDLMLYTPSGIKLFHVDFMLTVERMAGYVPEDWGWENKTKVKYLEYSSDLHDPLCQFLFIKNVVKRGIVEGDERLNSILSLSTFEFMNELQNVYGDSGRIKFIIQ